MTRQTQPPTVTYVQAPGVSEEEASAALADVWDIIMGPSDEEWARRHNLPWPPEDEAARVDTTTASKERDTP